MIIFSRHSISRAAAILPRLVRFLYMLFLLTVPARLSAKAVLYEGRDGLNSNDISTITKDSRGLLWIGTYNGLNIYDGYTFTKVQGPLSNLHITCLSYDKKNNVLFVGTNIGLYKVDLNTFLTLRMQPDRKDGAVWSMQRANAICIHPETGSIYVSFGKGYIASVSSANKLSMVCRLSDTGRLITRMVPGGDPNSLLVLNGELNKIDLADRKITPVGNFKGLGPLTSMSRSGDYLLLSGYNSNIVVADIHTFADLMPQTRNKGFPTRAVQSVLYKDQLYLLCDNYSFYVIDLRKNTVNEVSRKYSDVFEGKVYNALYVDEHGIIWIATNKGLIKLEERPITFTSELTNMPSRVSTRKMWEDEQGDVYVCSYNGLWHFSALTQRWTNYNNTASGPSVAARLAYSQPVQPLTIEPVPGSNYLYVGTDGDALLRFDKKKKIIEQLVYKERVPGNRPRGLYTMAHDRKGQLWLGCANGLATYDPATGTMNLHRGDAFDIGDLRTRYIYTQAGSDTLYVATTSGLSILDINKGIVATLNTSSRPALSSNDILFAEKDRDGDLWLGTNGGGINILSLREKKVRYIRRQDGLSNEIVYSIIAQDANTLWISTFNGLDRYRKDLRSFNNFFEDDGLSSNEFNQNSFLKAADGRLYFGSINGITSFYPQQFQPPAPFHIFISGISQWNDKSQLVELQRQLPQPENTVIKRPTDQLLEIHFGCTDYSDPQRNMYSYRIKELSDNWISLEDRHTLNLGGMPYGHFTIEVKAINSRGASSANMLVLHLKVTQPFYKTWWFFALLLLGLAGVFYMAYLIKYRNFKNVLHLRMKIASNLHDEVGSLLTRITMFSENLRYSKNTEEQRHVKLEKIAQLSRNAVASMSDVLWTIDSRNDFAGNLLDRMREHAEEMLFPLGIDVNFVLSGTDLKQPITSDTRGEIYLIFKEAINNIARHSDASRVDITYRIYDKSFLLKITNNNPRQEISGLSTGQGLNNMKMRASRIGAGIRVTKEEHQFTIEIGN